MRDTYTSFLFSLFLFLSLPALGTAGTLVPDPGCEAYQAWQAQMSVKSDPLGIRNTFLPEVNATYWITSLGLPAGTNATIRGRYPNSRYMSLQVYTDDGSLLDGINDQSIQPDAGQNNPFQTGVESGTYSVTIAVGPKPATPSPNTIYANNTPAIKLVYRVYYTTNTNDLSGATGTPALPEISINGSPLSTCPVRPIIQPEDSTVWGRLDNGDFAGAVPASQAPAYNPPIPVITLPDESVPYFPNKDNAYLTAYLSRDFLRPAGANDLVVVTFKAPTFPNTQGGEPPYLATTSRQLRFWGICVNTAVTSGVVRCLSDYQFPIRNGYATLVISDPSKKPSSQILAKHSAAWLPWGALMPGDSVYTPTGALLDNTSGVFYQPVIMYRQMMPNPAWTQSFLAVGKLPSNQWKAAMGEYWPVIGYCRANNFAQAGVACVTRRP